MVSQELIMFNFKLRSINVMLYSNSFTHFTEIAVSAVCTYGIVRKLKQKLYKIMTNFHMQQVLKFLEKKYFIFSV
jgi:beta-galactosidase GanA